MIGNNVKVCQCGTTFNHETKPLNMLNLVNLKVKTHTNHTCHGTQNVTL